jgi:hypothetical protein
LSQGLVWASLISKEKINIAVYSKGRKANGSAGANFVKNSKVWAFANGKGDASPLFLYPVAMIVTLNAVGLLTQG